MPDRRRDRSPLPAGSQAPGFVLPVTPDRRVALDEYRGARVVLVFYPADFSPVCSQELPLFNELLPEFERFNARVFGISVDSVWSHLAWARELNLRVPLLSDFWPHGEVSRRYRSFQDALGVSERSLFVVDERGQVFWSYLSAINANPGADGVLDALERLASRQVQPEAPL